MENEVGFGMDKKFGCVRVQTLRSTPCTVRYPRVLLVVLDALLDGAHGDACLVLFGD